MQRYTVTIIRPNHARPSMVFTYWVTGRGSFPFDMLRYDQAWPVERVGEIDKHGQVRSIKMMSYKAPTDARWFSFWWSVSQEPLGE